MRADRFLLLVLLLPARLALAGTGSEVDWSQTPPLGPERSFQPPRPTRLALDGGGTLLCVENHGLPLVTLLFAMPGAGSTADPEGRAGLAAYTADLLDEGAGGLRSRELAERLETLGSEITTWAEEDAAFIRLSSLARNLAPSLELAGKVLTAPTFSDEDGQRIHEDQTAAVRLRRDRPGAVANVVFEAGMYGAGAPYGHPAFGYLADLGRFGVADARDFYKQRFARDRLVVVVAGDIDPGDAQRKVEQALSGWRAGGAPAAEVEPAAAPASRARLLLIDRPGAEQANLVIGGIGLRRADERSTALDVLTNHLGGTFTSKLNHRLREELGYTYGVAAYPTYHRRTGAVVISSAVFTPKTAAAMREILRILGDVARKPLPAAELSATQLNLIRGLPQYFTTNDDLADAFSGLAVSGLPDDWFQGYADRVRAVTPAQVSALARSLFDPRRLIAVVVGPLAQIERELARAGLGKPRRFDPDGLPVAR